MDSSFIESEAILKQMISVYYESILSNQYNVSTVKIKDKIGFKCP
jgi:hypothetical protein